MSVQDRKSESTTGAQLSGERSGPGTAAEAGCVDSASWLSEDLLLLVGEFRVPAAGPVEAALVRGKECVAVELRHLEYRKPNKLDPEAEPGQILLAKLPQRERPSGSLGQMVIGTNGHKAALRPMELSDSLTDLRTLVRDSLAWLSAQDRAEVLAMVTSAAGGGAELSQNLAILRQALRERLPSCVIAADSRLAVHVDVFLALNEKSFYIGGWMQDHGGTVTHLTAISPEGHRAELLTKAHRHRRLDVEQLYRDPREIDEGRGHGFVCYFELDAPSRLPAGWVVEMRTSGGSGLETTAPEAMRDKKAIREVLLSDFAKEGPLMEELRANHLLPAISRFQQKQQALARVEATRQYGTPPRSAEVSIIIPLYKRIDFLEHQLAQFVHDPEIAKADLIYVLDSPEQAELLKELAAHLFELYQVPFRLVILAHNVGFSGANNMGASVASGRLLLLLNSDILPDRPGWLERMAAFHRSRQNIGALGAKLLFEDDSIQHAGLYFSRLARSGEWENLHYFKGLHRSLPAANVTRPVPAVTAACLMIDRELYQKAGGLRGIYVQGDYEDSDLCLRLAEQGLQNWYLAAVELYHLEGQSYDLASRSKNGTFNRWLHTRLWNERIGSIMRSALLS